MTISVIIPTLDEAQGLPAILSHTATLGFDEVIVVDGGSRDRTREIVMAFASALGSGSLPAARRAAEPDPLFTHHPSPITLVTSPAGRARQMNAGAAAAKSDVLLFLHADTRLPDDAGSAIERALADPACVGGRFDVRFDRDAGLSRVIGRFMNLRSRWTGIATGDQAIFVRRDAFERLGGFADIPIMEDVDFSRRLKRAGRVAALRSQVVTSYRRWHARGPIRTILLMWLLRFIYWIGVSPRTLSRFYSAVR